MNGHHLTKSSECDSCGADFRHPDIGAPPPDSSLACPRCTDKYASINHFYGKCGEGSAYDEKAGGDRTVCVNYCYDCDSQGWAWLNGNLFCDRCGSNNGGGQGFLCDICRAPASGPLANRPGGDWLSLCGDCEGRRRTG